MKLMRTNSFKRQFLSAFLALLLLFNVVGEVTPLISMAYASEVTAQDTPPTGEHTAKTNPARVPTTVAPPSVTVEMAVHYALTNEAAIGLPSRE